MGRKVYKCNICNYKFFTKKKYWWHLCPFNRECKINLKNTVKTLNSSIVEYEKFIRDTSDDNRLLGERVEKLEDDKERIMSDLHEHKVDHETKMQSLEHDIFIEKLHNVNYNKTIKIIRNSLHTRPRILFPHIQKTYPFLYSNC